MESTKIMSNTNAIESTISLYKPLKTTSPVKRKIILTIIYVCLSIWGFIAVFPICWVLINGFKTSTQIVLNPLSIPTGSAFTWANYAGLFGSTINIGLAYFNSIYTSTIIVVLTVGTAFFAAFAISRYRFRGLKIVSMFVIACMMFPAFSLMFPIYKIFDVLGFINQHIAIILPQVALNMGFATILLTGFLKSLPMSVEESAFIDGAGVLRTMFTIVVPMMRSALISCIIFSFLWTYNDLFFQTFLLRTLDKRCIPYLMMMVTQQQGVNYGIMAASSALISIPMLVIYLLLQKHIIKGLTAGAIKG